MDESTRKMLEKMADASKPSESLRGSIQEMHNRITNIASPPIRWNLLEDLDPELLEPPKQEDVNFYQSASVLMKALANEAQQWKDRLPEGYRPAILALLYGGIQINAYSLAKVSFHGIRIEGTMNDAPCSILAHQSTVQILCYAEEIKEDAPRNPIGFIWDDNRVEV